MLVFESLVVGLITTLVCCYVTFAWKRRRLYELAAKIPGPSNELPFIGSALELLGKNNQGELETIVIVVTFS